MSDVRSQPIEVDRAELLDEEAGHLPFDLDPGTKGGSCGAPGGWRYHDRRETEQLVGLNHHGEARSALLVPSAT